MFGLNSIDHSRTSVTALVCDNLQELHSLAANAG